MTAKMTRRQRQSRGQIELWDDRAVTATRTRGEATPPRAPRRPRQLARANPALYRWARESLRLELNEAAARLRVPVGRLKRWEAGLEAPTIPQLRKIAKAYRRSLPVFYLPDPPTDWPVPRDFRRSAGGPPPVPSVELLVAVRRAWEQRSVALDLDPEAPPCDLVGIHLRGESAHALAARVRSLLAVTVEQQQGWPQDHGALNAWRALLERGGVMVVHFTGVTVAEVRGFSISESVLPVIAVNGHDSVNGRIFTLAHELGHLLLGEGGACDLGDATQPSAVRDRIEVFCNRFAGGLLVPADALLADPVVARADARSEWDAVELDRLARHFRVSREVVLRRLTTVGRADAAFYRRFRSTMLVIPPRDPEEERTGGGPGPALIVVRDVGKPFARLVLDAYHSDQITGPDASAFLGVGMRHFPAIERRLAGSDVLTGGDA